MKISNLILAIVAAVAASVANGLFMANTTIEVKQEGVFFYDLVMHQNGSTNFMKLFPRKYAPYVMFIGGGGEDIRFSLSYKPSGLGSELFYAHFMRRPFIVSNIEVRYIKSEVMNYVELNHNSIAHLDGPSPKNSTTTSSVSSGKLHFVVYDDADDDGLKDIDEYELYGAWPGMQDSDGDGLTDGEEVKLTHTRPMLYDTDGDGIGDKDDDGPLMPCFCTSYSAWTAHWKGVASDLAALDDEWKDRDLSLLDDENADFDGDFIDNRTEYLQRTSPLFKPGLPRIVFNERELVRSPEEDIEKSFEFRVLSHSSLTGVIYVSEANLPISFELDKFQFLPGAELPSPPSESCARMFLARYGLPIRVNAKLPMVSKGDVACENFYVLSGKARLNNCLPVVSQAGGGCGNSFVNPPELLSPEAGGEIRNTGIAFSWSGNFKSYRLSLMDSDGHFLLSEKTYSRYYSFDMDSMKTGRYYWSVTGVDKQGNETCSPFASFLFLHPDGDVSDSDGDGFADNEEFLRGTDPNNGDEFPMGFGSADDTSLEMRKGQYFTRTMNVSGGVGLRHWHVKGSLPEGLELQWNGVLCGVPSATGNYDVTFMVCDSTGEKLERTYSIRVLTAAPSQTIPGGGRAGR